MDEAQSIRERKRRQRETALAARAALSAQFRAAASREVCGKLLRLEATRTAKTILLFSAFGTELDLSFFARQAERDGKTLLYPRCAEGRRLLALRPGERWETNAFGILEPALEDAVSWEPEQIDLILCPCAAFDEKGNRLGMGAGYYDRFLPRCPQAKKILTAFEAQRLPAVCTESCDVPMDAVITEKRSDFYER